MPDVFGFFDAIIGITLVGVLVGLLVPVAVIVLIVWAIRRSAPVRRDPAEEELRGRLARGEIDMAEYQVRLGVLRDGDRR